MSMPEKNIEMKNTLSGQAICILNFHDFICLVQAFQRTLINQNTNSYLWDHKASEKECEECSNPRGKPCLSDEILAVEILEISVSGISSCQNFQ